MTRLRELRGPLVAGWTLTVASWAFISFTPVFRLWLFGDARFYEVWGSQIAAHQLPYRDFNLEYPPGSIPAFVLPSELRKAFAYHGTYFFWLRVEILVLLLISLAVMAYALSLLEMGRRQAYVALCAAGVAPAVLGPTAFFHYDALVALLAVAAVTAMLAGRDVLACAIASAGALVKIYPLLLVPLALIALWRRARMRGLAQGIAASVTVLAAGTVPFAVLAPSGVGWAIHRETSRPLEAESIGSSFFVAAHHLWGAELHPVMRAASRGFVGSGPHAMVDVLTVLSIVSVLAVYRWFSRSSGARDDIVVAAVALVTLFIVFSKVFSPQYLIWLFALVPLLRGRFGVQASAFMLVILGVTQIFEPYQQARYWRFSTAWIDWTVVGRNVLVVAFCAFVLRAMLRREATLD